VRQISFHPHLNQASNIQGNGRGQRIFAELKLDIQNTSFRKFGLMKLPG